MMLLSLDELVEWILNRRSESTDELVDIDLSCFIKPKRVIYPKWLKNNESELRTKMNARKMGYIYDVYFKPATDITPSQLIFSVGLKPPENEKFFIILSAIRQNMLYISSARTIEFSGFFNGSEKSLQDLQWFNRQKINNVLMLEKIGRIVSADFDSSDDFYPMTLTICVQSGYNTEVEECTQMLEEMQTAVKKFKSHLEEKKLNRQNDEDTDIQRVSRIIDFMNKWEMTEKLEKRISNLEEKFDVGFPLFEEKTQKNTLEEIRTEYKFFQRCGQ